MTESRTTDALEAQARELASRLGSRYCRHWNGAYCDVCSEGELIAWARRLVGESRAGALREAASVVENAPLNAVEKYAGITFVSFSQIAAALRALAAEAAPGA